MALALDGSSPAKVAKAGAGNTATTASFTAPANSLLYATWGQDTSGTVNTSIADTGGLQWTRVARLYADTVGEANTPTPTGTAQQGYISTWKATTTSATARTVTVTEAGAGGTGKTGTLVVKVFTDTGGAPTVGAVTTKGGSASVPSNTVTTTAANSWCWASSCDWSAGGPGTCPSGQTETDTNTASGLDTEHVWKQNATTANSGTVVTMNLTAPTGQTWNMAAVEILANSGGGTTPVTGTKAAAWHVRAQAQQTKDSAWHIRSTVADATKDAAWTVRTTVADATKAAAWHVRAQAQATRDAAWHVRAAVQQTQDSAWTVRTTVADATKVAAWHVRAQAQQTKAAAWNVWTSVATATKDATWHVRAVVQATRDAAWTVCTTVADATKATAWHIRSQAEATKDSAWHVRAQAEATKASAWNVAAPAAVSLVGSAVGVGSSTTLVITNTSGQTIPAGTLLVLSYACDNPADLSAPTLSASPAGGSAWTVRLAPTGSGA